MNRRDLVKAIAAQTEVDAKTVDAVVKGFTDVTTAVVSQGRAGGHHGLRQVRQGGAGGPHGPQPRHR